MRSPNLSETERAQLIEEVTAQIAQKASGLKRLRATLKRLKEQQ